MKAFVCYLLQKSARWGRFSFMLLPVGLCVWLFTFAFSVPSAYAATFTVNSSLDVNDANPGNGICDDGSGNCTLRAALSEANALTGADIIILPAGIYTLTLTGANENGNVSGDLDVDRGSVTIQGADAETTIIQAGTTITNGIDRVFHLLDVFVIFRLEDVTVRYGRAPVGSNGGGILVSDGTLTLVNSVLEANHAGDGSSGGGNGGHGGGIYANVGSVSLQNSHLQGNSAGNGSDNSSGIGGSGHGGEGGAIYSNGTVVTVNHSQIIGNSGGHGGDGSNGSNAGNGGDGGGINVSGASLSVYSSTISSNTGGDSGVATGGGMNAFGGDGGGLFLRTNTVILNSTISSNTVGFGSIAPSLGGGVYVNFPSTVVDIVNSTLSANDGGIRGGAVFNFNGTTRLKNVTMSGNVATQNGGTIYVNAGTVDVQNSIITDSAVNDCFKTASSTLSGSNNLVDDHNTGGACDPISTAAVTNFDTTLADNGGPTLTHALLPGSNARNNGANNCPDQNSTPLIRDQRGISRPQSTACDIGAFELVNQPPTAVPDTYSLDEDNALTDNAPGVLGNDVEPEGDMMTATLSSGPANGLVELAVDGAFVYTPTQNFAGSDQFVYAVSDGFLTTMAVVTLTVNPVNDPPVVLADSDTTNEDTAVTTDVLANDSDLDGNLVPGSVAVISLPANGVAAVNLTSGTITYTPTQDFNGTDTYVYEACDDGTPLPALCGTAVVTITVNAVNDPPDTVDDADMTIEDTAVATDVLTNDGDRDGSLVPGSVAIVSGPEDGTAVVNLASGVVTYTPTLNFNGQDVYVYQVCDDGTPLPSACATAAVTITVNAVNDPPVIMPDADTTDEDTAVTTAVLANDSDVDGNLDLSTMTIITAPVNGMAVVNVGTGEVTYTPSQEFSGADSYVYQICDDGTPLPALCGMAVVNLTINAVNDPPVAVDDTDTTDEDTAVTTDVLANDSDVDGNLDPASVSVTGGPGNGVTAVNLTTGAVTYTPTLNFNGQDVYTYQVCDDGVPLPPACTMATVTVTINAVNDPPIVVDDTAVTETNTVVTITVLANDSDLDGNLVPGSVNVISPPANGTATAVAATGQIVYTPTMNFVGTDTFEYEVCDDGTPLPALCGSAIVTVTILLPNQAPQVDAGPDQQADEGQMISFSGVYTDTGDVTIHWDFGDGDEITGTLVPTHTYLDNGVFIVTLTITDDQEASGSDTLTVTVNNVAPTVVAGADMTISPGDVVNFNGSFTDPGVNDTHMIEWDFDDGGTAVGTLTPTHTFTVPGVYTVTLTVTDDDGGAGSDTLTITVLEDQWFIYLPVILRPAP